MWQSAQSALSCPLLPPQSSPVRNNWELVLSTQGSQLHGTPCELPQAWSPCLVLSWRQDLAEAGCFFQGSTQAPTSSSYYTSLPIERGFCFNPEVPQFPLKSWAVATQQDLSRWAQGRGGMRTEAPLCSGAWTCFV